MPAMTVRLRLYTGKGCGLCTDTRELLAGLAAEFDWLWEEIDIASDPVLLERYRQRIPAVTIEGGPTLFAPITAEALMDAIAGCQP